MSDTRPIGVFDSGLGGLTVLKQLEKMLPNEDLVYFGDTARVPYGNKSASTVIRYACEDIEFLQKYNVKMTVVACGTASSVAVPVIKEDYDIPLFGVVESAVNAAVEKTKRRRIGVIGTNATISSNSYYNAIKQKDNDIEVTQIPCPLLVPLVEDGRLDGEVTRIIVKEYADNFTQKDIDVLILGCTHYSLLSSVISDILGDGVTLIDTGVEIAKTIKTYLAQNNLLNNKGGTTKFYASDGIEAFETVGGLFLGRSLTAEKIMIGV